MGRTILSNNQPLRVGGINVDPSGNVIFMENHDVLLEPRVMDVLCVLAASANTVVLRDKLIEQAWDVEYVSDESVTRVISLLRKAFKQFDPQTEYIQTVPKRGYRLSAEVEYGQAATAETAISGSVKSNARKRLAFLPFKQIDEVGERLYLAECAIEELSSRLRGNSSLGLVGQTSIDAVAGNGLTLPEIASKLGVSHLIEGTVHRRAEMVTLSIRLIEGATGEQIWSDHVVAPEIRFFEQRGVIGTNIIASLYRTLEVEYTPCLSGA